MKPDIRFAFTLAIATLTMGSVPTNALPSQTWKASLQAQNPTRPTTIIRTNNTALSRAKNLARQAAETANGGLSQYRAEDSMHGPAAASPYVDNKDGTWTFTIKGRRPNSSVFTIETVVTVSQDGKRVTVDYNGPIRQR